MRKRKHVTFQLADSAIVEPSSSYEEMPSPGPKLRSESEDEASSIDEHMAESITSSIDGQNDTDDMRGPQSPAPAFLSPQIRGREREGSADSDTSGFSGGFTGADDGGSGVGFFELDEELSSPGPVETKSLKFDVQDLDPDDVHGNPGGGKVIDEKYGSFGVGSVPIDIVRPTGSWVGSFGH